MRWIFISLAVMNGLLLGWLLLFHDPQISSNPTFPSYVQQGSGQQVSTLKLLSEMTEMERSALVFDLHKEQERIQTSGSIDSGAGEVSSVHGQALPMDIIEESDPESLCTLVGPFPSLLKAEYFTERITALNVRAMPKEVKMPAGPGYWVYLKPEPSRREALRVLAELQAKGIDSYVIPKGDLENGISLGMFSQKTLADARVEETESLGLVAKIDIVERTYKEIWVVLNKKEALKLSDTSWAGLMEGYDDLERRQNFCLDVAS